MAVLIDPPVWPAHGTVYSHLVSDTSLAELHAFAERLGAHPRAFDADHYDVPERLYADAVALGAEPVSGTELVRRLIASGLRRPKGRREQAETALTERLAACWDELLPGHEDVGTELLQRWGEPHRRYHDRRHLAECLDSLDRLETRGETVSLEVRLAAWFHDAVYDGAPGEDEERSALLAQDRLDGIPGVDAAEVARLVRVTATQDPEPQDHAGAVVSDADLAILAAPRERYAEYVRDVRIDFAHVADDAFRAGRRAVVQDLLARPDLYHTSSGRWLWDKAARSNLRSEL